MITKFATPFYPAYVWRGSLNFLRKRLNRTFYEFIILKHLRVAINHFSFTIQSFNDIHKSQEIKTYTGYLMQVTYCPSINGLFAQPAKGGQVSALCSKNNPRNINYMPAVIFFACLDLEQKSSFMDGHYLILGLKIGPKNLDPNTEVIRF
ncbi:MAG: hypothetical protein SRB2_04661 [Desulfobacteraceae bacterium Eth-SRB2]|nr:MAG: hypothetical protein SRB2_04661 [Desulfobacteraceae bacterium Eth-SRB2]